MLADLHIHTTASDGCWGPERVVAEVQSRSIGLFAVTDHDVIGNVAPVEALAREAGLAFLRGVEVSSWLGEHYFHILAYGFEADAHSFFALLRENRAKMMESNREVIHRMIARGYPIDPEDFEAYSYDQTRGGWKALNFLIDHGLCTGVKDYFEGLKVGPSQIYRTFPHPAEVIAAIKEAGGVPVLAHPGATLKDVGVTAETLQPLLDFGIAGLECYHRHNDEATTCFCLDWCASHDLIVTVGSDCHGGLVDRELGFPPIDTADLRLGELEERIIY
ncbi:MAG: PHP domain-containing protein [Anaerolineae bacterium]|jgi:predicted metal-dependent phosphoesterase TrpH